MMSVIDIFKKSIQDFRTNWNVIILASLPIGFLSLFLQYDKTVGLLLFLVLSGPLRLGLSKISLLAVGQQPLVFSQVFDGFKNFKNTLGVFLLSLVFTLLGLFLLIVPGIIIAIWLSQSFFILAEKPYLDPMEVFKKSRELIRGEEYKYLLLIFIFVFISVVLLLLKLAVLALLLLPIQYLVFANFYQYLLHK